MALDSLPGKAGTSSGDQTSRDEKDPTIVRVIPVGDQSQVQHQRSRKSERGWERSPDCVLDIGKTAAIPSFSSDEEVTGIITMEDVIEELLQV